MRSVRDWTQRQRPPRRQPPTSSWDADADADAEAQLLRGLLTFRDRAVAAGGGVGGLAKLLSTPAASFDVEFARELQSLHLNLLPGSDAVSGGGSPTKTPLPAEASLDVSGDMLAMAADMQMRQGLHWRRQSQQQLGYPGTGLRLQAGRFGGFFFMRRGQPRTPTGSMADGDADEEGETARRRRLTYRNSIAGPPTQPDAEVERLLRSRTPTLLAARASPAPPMPVVSVSIVTSAAKRSGAHSAKAAIAVPNDGAPETTGAATAAAPVAASAAAIATVALPSANRSSESLTLPLQLSDDSLGVGSRAAPQQKRGGRNRRRKVTGLDMLEGIDVRNAPPGSPQSQIVSLDDSTTVSSMTAPMRSSMSRRQPPAPDVSNVGTGADVAASFKGSRGRSWLSQDVQADAQPAAWMLRGHSIESGDSAAISRRIQTSSEQQKQSQSQLLPHQQHQQPVRQSSVSTQSVVPVPAVQQAAAPSTPAVQEQQQPQQRQDQLPLLPAPDQYRVAHEMARTANLNAQFETWLRLGRDPADFFSCRTTTGSYSYFPRLPRYDRGLDPFQTSLHLRGEQQPTVAPQYNSAVRQQFYSRKLTPAYLAYGGKNPDDYLPAPKAAPHVHTARPRPQTAVSETPDEGEILGDAVEEAETEEENGEDTDDEAKIIEESTEVL